MIVIIRSNRGCMHTYQKHVEAVDIEQAKEGRADRPHGHGWSEVRGGEVHDDALRRQQEDRFEAEERHEYRYSIQRQEVEPILKHTLE